MSLNSKFKSLLTVAALVSAVGIAPVARATPDYSASFQGVTFDVTQTSSTAFSFDILGATSATGDWTGINFLSSFSFKGLGIDFNSASVSATAYYHPSGPTIDGTNSQLSASNLDCSSSTGQTDIVCFYANPYIALTSSMLFDISITGGTLNFASTGPHLQIAFTTTQGGRKTGSLYSEDLPSTSSSSSGGGGASSGGNIPEPATLALVGLGFLAVAAMGGRRAARAA
jgi:hypothetical protein